jgi:hypothetical protein
LVGDDEAIASTLSSPVYKLNSAHVSSERQSREKETLSKQPDAKSSVSLSKQIAARGRDRGPGGTFLANEEAASSFCMKARLKYCQYKSDLQGAQLPLNLLTGCSLVFTIQPGQESDIYYKDGKRQVKFLEFGIEMRSHENKLVPITLPLVACLHVENDDPMYPVGEFIEELPLPLRKRRRCSGDREEIYEYLLPELKEPLSYRNSSSLLLENGKASVGIKANVLSKSFQGSRFIVVFYIDLIAEPMAPFVKPGRSRPFVVKSKEPTSISKKFEMTPS